MLVRQVGRLVLGLLAGPLVLVGGCGADRLRDMCGVGAGLFLADELCYLAIVLELCCIASDVCLAGLLMAIRRM